MFRTVSVAAGVVLTVTTVLHAEQLLDRAVSWLVRRTVAVRKPRWET